MLKIEVSPGDFLDRLTILEIKQERITDPSKLANVAKEIKAMRKAGSVSGVNLLRDHLRTVNARIWDLENAIRKPQSDASFIGISQEIREANEQRASLKRQINAALSSPFMEEKDYQ